MAGPPKLSIPPKERMVGDRRRAAAPSWSLCVILRPEHGKGPPRRLRVRRSNAPFGGRGGGEWTDTVVRVDRTRALAVDAAQAKDQGVVWLVGGIGIVGIALMLAIDLLLFQAA